MSLEDKKNFFSYLDRARKFKTKKSLGQNFLTSEETLIKIADSLNPSLTNNLLEIGCGAGFLTENLLERGYKVTALDFDQEALKTIKSHSALNLIHCDALQFDYDSLAKPFSVAGNLPFNVGTQILLNFLGEMDNPNWQIDGIKEMVLMFQYEVAERIAAGPGSKAYSPLSILVHSKCNVEFLFKVPAKYFHPVPKVDAGVVRITPMQVPKVVPLNEKERKLFRIIVKKAFMSRRKKLSNCVKEILSSQQLIEAGVSPDLRPEQISVDEFINLAKFKAALGEISGEN
ncbi:MAG: 16S rRNA (adenine(1518)-N(6)/adenine(1519)-N(6))-dimethyltransferase RsmA [Candidatus Caenarcaniphilales bacterium]|nr:16S rRNA (adenine(1518)-N(6)/adenine(1519)-N(6))-dimethyltransferase RsmA [Candidatus Caenarcaniphilales bacterium]